jgi:hypothetical protein
MHKLVSLGCIQTKQSSSPLECSECRLTESEWQKHMDRNRKILAFVVFAAFILLPLTMVIVSILE